MMEDLIAENTRLKSEIKNLNGKICKLQDDQGYTICKYFNSCKSLQETAEQYCFDSVKDCYHALVYYFDSEDPCKTATDYIQYYSEIFGREYKETHYHNSDSNEEDEDDDE
jgi:hypothetical protein